MDELLEGALAYQRLLGVAYRVIIGRKGKTVDLRISFDSTNFHHLAGLHKLKDLTIATDNRHKVLHE